jgi:hypothetical protein
MLNAVCNEYRGLVPISPKTTPKAPRVRTALVPFRGSGMSEAGGVAIAVSSVSGFPSLGSVPLLVTLEWLHVTPAAIRQQDTELPLGVYVKGDGVLVHGYAVFVWGAQRMASSDDVLGHELFTPCRPPS